MRLHALTPPASLGAAFAIAAACAGGGQRSPCQPVSPETAQFAARAVYRECEVTSRAVAPVALRTIPYSSSSQSCVRAVIEVVIDSAGTPLIPTARILRTNDTTYAAAVLAAIGKAQFKPASRDGRAVAQLVSIERTATTNAGKLPFAVKGVDGPVPPVPPVLPPAVGC